MNFFKKLFWKNKEKQNSSNTKFDLTWIEAADTPWNVKVLDLRPISQVMLSSSENASMASNALSYGQDDGTSFIGKKPQSKRMITANLVFRTDGKLLPGALLIPSSMENKWAIYYHDNRLIFIRSWMREVFVVADTVQEENKLIVTKITGDFAGEDTEDYTKSALAFLIHSHALGEIVPVPIPDWLKSDTDTNAAGLWTFSTYGNMAHYGYFDTDFNYSSDNPLRSHSLLHIAIARGNKKEINKQLELGVDINALAADGLSTIHWAVDPNILEFLIQKGGDPNALSVQRATPLMNAVQSNEEKNVQVLLNHNANVNAQDHRGFTALHRAAEMGHKKLVQMLLDHGANKNVEAEGHTALSLARMREESEIIKILESHN